MSYGPTCTLEQAAELMNIHPQTVVLKYIDTGELPAAKLGRGYVMMTADVLGIVQRTIAQQTSQRMRRITPPANEPTYRPRRRRVG